MAQSAQPTRQALVYDTQDEVNTNLATYIFNLYKTNVAAKDRFTIVLSGQAESIAMGTLVDLYKKKVDWRKWYVFFVDEKVVPLTDPNSNYQVNYANFLSKVDIPKDQIYQINYSTSPRDVAQNYTSRIRKAVSDGIVRLDNTGFPKFDLLLLGMGPDGHFASLFPNYPQLLNDTDWVTYLTSAPETPSQRITFTFPVVNCATNVALLALGSSQAAAVQQSINELDAAEMPTGQLQQAAAGNVTWFLDVAAASQLDPPPSST